MARSSGDAEPRAHAHAGWTPPSLLGRRDRRIPPGRTEFRELPEPTAHTRSPTALAYDLHNRLALQRARVCTVSLRAENLIAAEQAPRQLLFEPTDKKARRIEVAADRAQDRFGAEAVQPAGAATFHVA
ncbi:hypothetical protein [Streptomyces phaeochromogenes]|uniref:hypothetical protein n=1 Tax=Streptomyces phaeochromogenes TaxID=1923 RepID=UPI002DDBED33|nr:hypothetical protein [Streptomyces phaeochromogenes]